MTVPVLTIAILAGGAASRLGGRDKGLELVDGRPLIEWVLDAIVRMHAFESVSFGGAAGSLDTAPISNRIAASPSRHLLIVANRHRDEYSRYAHTIRDAAAGFRGPLAGVAAALGVCTTAWLLTLPVDCPAPPSDLADRLLCCALQSGARCVIAHDGERRQPLFAVYRQELALSAVRAIDAGQGVWQWQDSIAALELDFSSQRRQFQNLNTPQDFSAYANLRLAR